MVQLLNIFKSFGNKAVLHDVGFVLNEAEITAFVGPNGAGKSTTMSVLTGVLAPDKGRVVFDGVDLHNSPEKIKAKIGYMPEINAFYDDMYVKEYLEYVAGFYMPEKRIGEQVDKMIETVSLQNEYYKKIQSLSFGNKRRVGLAQALIHDPEILILDEPTNGLDPNQQMRINELIKTLGETKTILFSSHNLEDVKNIASRYLIINNGKIVLDAESQDVESLESFYYTLTE